ncbi:hypothetical protein [Streptomyces rishiriensis]|uniref:hypothetical protein n=1 Tax=Streptomyces rishiriensis TaxID=68264 RepID=UPI0037CE75D9
MEYLDLFRINRHGRKSVYARGSRDTEATGREGEEQNMPDKAFMTVTVKSGAR